MVRRTIFRTRYRLSQDGKCATAKRQRPFVAAVALAAWAWSGERPLSDVPGADVIRPAVVERAARAVVVIRTPRGQGAGFFLSRDGWLLTNAHVLSGAEAAEIETREGRRFPVQFVGACSLKQDLLLVKIAGTFEFLECADPQTVRVGDPVFVIGHPYGHNWTMSKGYIAAKRTEDGCPIIQYSADISPGNSGGPILTADGRVGGVATYLERRAIQFNDGSYTLDPSTVLKFGIGCEAFSTLMADARRGRMSLAEFTAWERRVLTAQLVSGITEKTHELLTDLAKGMAQLTVERSADPAAMGRRHSRSGGAAVLGNTEAFVQSAHRFRALGALLDQHAPGAERDEDVRRFCERWRSAMARANEAIDAIVAADGASLRRAGRLSRTVTDALQQSYVELGRAAGFAERIVSRYQAHLSDAAAVLKRMRDIRQSMGFRHP